MYVCMYVCMYIYICIYREREREIYTHTHKQTRARARANVRTHARTHARTHTRSFMPRPLPHDRVLKDRLEEVLGCSLRSKQLILGVVESLVFWEGQSLWQRDLGQLKLARGREARETESCSSS